MLSNEKDLVKMPLTMSKLLKKFHSFSDEVLEKHHLSRIHVPYLMNMIECKGHMSNKDLSAQLGVDKANTSRAVSELIEKGLMKNEMDEQTKSYQLILTEKGLAIALELRTNNARHVQEFLDVLSLEEKMQLKAILTKLTEQL